MLASAETSTQDPAETIDAPVTPEAGARRKLGERIGRFIVWTHLGSGAFGEVWKLGPHGGAPVVLAKTPNIALAGILVQEDRTIWFGSDGRPGSVISLDPSTRDFSRPIPVGTTANRGGPGCSPIWLTLGGSYLWVTNADDRTLSVIAVVSLQGVDTIPLSGKPNGLAFGVGEVWVGLDLR